MVGKWHLGADWQLLEKRPEGNDHKDASWRIDYSKPFKNGPFDVGFNEAFFILSSLDMAPYVYLRNNKTMLTPSIDKMCAEGMKHESGKVELYDLSKDRGEKNNLADQFPDIAKKLGELMDKAWTEPRSQEDGGVYTGKP
jgi:hypothetical protein